MTLDFYSNPLGKELTQSENIQFTKHCAGWWLVLLVLLVLSCCIFTTTCQNSPVFLMKKLEFTNQCNKFQKCLTSKFLFSSIRRLLFKEKKYWEWYSIFGKKRWRALWFSAIGMKCNPHNRMLLVKNTISLHILACSLPTSVTT